MFLTMKKSTSVRGYFCASVYACSLITPKHSEEQIIIKLRGFVPYVQRLFPILFTSGGVPISDQIVCN